MDCDDETPPTGRVDDEAQHSVAVEIPPARSGGVRNRFGQRGGCRRLDRDPVVGGVVPAPVVGHVRTENGSASVGRDGPLHSERGDTEKDSAVGIREGKRTNRRGAARRPANDGASDARDPAVVDPIDDRVGVDSEDRACARTYPDGSIDDTN